MIFANCVDIWGVFQGIGGAKFAFAWIDREERLNFCTLHTRAGAVWSPLTSAKDSVGRVSATGGTANNMQKIQKQYVF